MPRDPKLAAIPVFMDDNWERPIGRGVVDTDGDILILASGDIMLRDLPNLVELGQITGISMSVQYKLPASKEATGG